MQVKRISQSIKDNGIKGPHGNEIRLEMFCHGALCMSISGKCYLSLDEYNSSANRGGCYQLCRRGYEVTDLETGRKLNIDNKYIMSPKDLCTIEFVDKMANAGVSVFKIEGRARSAEYVGIVTRAYREALDAVEKGIFDNDLGARLKARLSEVFNRGFWDGYYMGARLGEWSSVYGNKATRKKTYCGRVTNYFTKIKVAEILIEAAELSKGMHILIIGPSTGAIEADVSEIRVDLKPSGIAQKGEYCSIPVEAKLRRSDKVYIFE
jgi:putative protease